MKTNSPFQNCLKKLFSDLNLSFSQDVALVFHFLTFYKPILTTCLLILIK